MSTNALSLARLTKPIPRRGWLVLIALGALLLMAFYFTTDSARLADDHALDGADYVGYAICHRLTNRSFTVAGRQLPLCARCTGIYLGVSLTFLLFFLAGRSRWIGMPPLKLLLVLLGFIGLMGIDGINSYSHFFPDAPHLYEPRNELRLVTGMGAGLAMGAILFPALSQTLWRDQNSRPIVQGFGELIGLVLIGLLGVSLVLSNQPVILYVLSIVSAVGVLIVLGTVNTVLMLIILKKDAVMPNWRRALVPLMIGLSLAIVQIAVVSYFRFAFTGTMTGLPGISG